MRISDWSSDVCSSDLPLRPAWLRNAVPSPDPGQKPMIAVVVDDMGIDQKRSRQAIALPAPLTLAFIPYGYHLPELTEAAHAAGHELLVHQIGRASCRERVCRYV